MYLAYQVNGLLFDVFRKDGLPFQEKHLNIQYHGKPGSVGIVDSRD